MLYRHPALVSQYAVHMVSHRAVISEEEGGVARGRGSGMCVALAVHVEETEGHVRANDESY